MARFNNYFDKRVRGLDRICECSIPMAGILGRRSVGGGTLKYVDTVWGKLGIPRSELNSFITFPVKSCKISMCLAICIPHLSDGAGPPRSWCSCQSVP